MVGVEVTAEMIAAGMVALEQLATITDKATILREVYRAMRALEPVEYRQTASGWIVREP